MTAGEASAHFLQSLEPEKARTERPRIEPFVAAFGEERPITELAPEDVSRYARSAEGQQDEEALEPLRAFLAYLARLSFTRENLVPALHLGTATVETATRGKSGAAVELGVEAYHVTVEGLAGLERELEELKAQRPRIAEELRAAMADKDFRENAPLDAARDAQAHLEARVRDIENRLRHAVIIDPNSKQGRANVGSTVKLLDMNSEREQTFHLVSPTEVDPSKGKISIQSPVGSALIDHSPGDEVTVDAPSGKLRFRLLDVIG